MPPAAQERRRHDALAAPPPDGLRLDRRRRARLRPRPHSDEGARRGGRRSRSPGARRAGWRRRSGSSPDDFSPARTPPDGTARPVPTRGARPADPPRGGAGRPRRRRRADEAVGRGALPACTTPWSRPQARSVHVAQVDPMLLADGTYFALERRRRARRLRGLEPPRQALHGQRGRAGLWWLLDPASEPARVRAMFVRADGTRRGLGRRILEACEEAARAEGFTRSALVATLPGVPLYLAYGFRPLAEYEVTFPDGIAILCVSMGRASRGARRRVAGLPVQGVSELVLEVSDLERAERFYVDVLGLPVVERWPGRGAVWVMAGSGTRIGLWSPRSASLAAGAGDTSTTRCGSTRRLRRRGRAPARPRARPAADLLRGQRPGPRALRRRSRRQRRRALDLGRRPPPRPRHLNLRPSETCRSWLCPGV